jgi:hypothetical protein
LSRCERILKRSSYGSWDPPAADAVRRRRAFAWAARTGG